MDLFTTAVPPSLPACLSVGITYSLSRLKKKDIFCIQRDNVNKAGSVNILVFDKTGTLTEDHLDISGYVSVKLNDKNQFEFLPFTSDAKTRCEIILDHFKKKINEPKKYKSKNKDLLQYYTECLACCHCLTYVKDKLVGDPIDVKMFEALDWIMKENDSSSGENNSDPLVLNYIRPKSEEDIAIRIQDNDENLKEKIKDRYELGIVKRFDFSSKLQRMSTISKNINEDHFKIFCKGSPEKLRDLCKPETIPLNFDQVLNSYTTKGYRVLAMAAKGLRMEFQQSQTIAREDVEKNMIFLGLLIVKNKLKERTKDSLIKYDNADLRMLMATGDNILTAICVSKECNLIRKNQEMYSCELEKNGSGKEVLKWKKMEGNDEEDENIGNNNKINLVDEEKKENNTILYDDGSNISLYELHPPEAISPNYKPTVNTNEKKGTKKAGLKMEDENDIIDYNNKQSLNSSRISNKTEEISAFDVEEEGYPLNKTKIDSFGVAITGPVFEKLFKLNKKYMKTKDKELKNIHESYRQVLKNGRVFARMAPEHKALLVEALKGEGFITLMCGDGANDCAALRTAHVGVSLSAEEASIAAGFTSKTPDVSCIFELLREGKCSLTTSIQTFKYMMLYSMIQFICVTFEMIYISYLTDFQFLVSDLFIIFPLEWFLAMTHPYHELTHHYPVSGLLSFPVISSILIQTILVFIFQFVGYIILQKSYEFENNCDFDDKEDPLPCHANTIFFIIAHFQYLTLALAFSVSKPFRQRIYMNWPLMIYLVLIYFYSIWITINCDEWSAKLFNLYDLKYKEEDSEEGEEEEEEDDGTGAGAGGSADGEDEEGEEEESNIIEGGENMKYYLLLIVGVNMIVNIFVEWFIMKFVRICYENRVIENYRKDIEEERLIEAQNNYNGNAFNEKEAQIYKYQRIYYYERRKKNEKQETQEKQKNINDKKTNSNNVANAENYSSTLKINVANSNS